MDENNNVWMTGWDNELDPSYDTIIEYVRKSMVHKIPVKKYKQAASTTTMFKVRTKKKIYKDFNCSPALAEFLNA